MIFFAHVKPKCPLERRWKAIALQSGLYLGIIFRRGLDGTFWSDSLTPDQVAYLNKVQSEYLILEAAQTVPGASPEAPQGQSSQ